ncbi:MAG TPA: hypothetical protein VM243_02630 [Phycisphaerae bacterium]|nr:hypothetical protein [Phycisphaerae bacterium]
MADIIVPSSVALTQADAMMNKVFERDHIVTSAYFGNTARFIQKRTPISRSTTVKFLTQRYSGSGVTSNLEADARTATLPETAVTELEITRSNLRRIDATIQHSFMAADVVDGGKLAIWNLAARQALEVLQNLDEKEDQLLNSDADALKAVVMAVYAADGSGAYGGSADTAILTIDQGGVSNFTPGEVIHIRDGTTAATLNNECVVTDVFEDGIVGTYDLGYPALRVQLTSATTASVMLSGTQTTITIESANDAFDQVADGDELVHQGDGSAVGFDAGFISMANIDNTYFDVIRTTAGNNYLVPFNKSFASGGVDQPIDLAALFDWIAVTVSKHIGPAAMQLARERIEFSKSLVCQVPPDLMPCIERAVGDASRRWNVTTVQSLADAKAKKVLGVMGYDGVVVKTFSLPPVVFIPEQLMSPTTVRVWAPEVFEWLQLGNAGRQPLWLPNDANGRWHTRRNVTTGNLSVVKDAFAYRVVAPFCRCPKLVANATGLTSS